MKREFRYTIEDESVTIERFLTRRKWPDSIITVLKQDNTQVLVNDKPSSTKTVLNAGDTLIIQLDEKTNKEIEPKPYPLKVVYEDEDLLVVYKPYDMPMHPSRKQHAITLANAVRAYLNEPFVFRCPTRLDRDTSGLVIVAKNRVASAILSDQAKKHQIQKEYLAIAEGKIDAIITINAPIDRIGETMIREVNYDTGKEAITHLFPEKYYPEQNVTLIRLVLETGRTHQIRVHTKYIGHPLVGDLFYNRENRQMNRQALMAHKISFIHPVTFREMSFEIEMDDDFKELLKGSC